MSFTNLIYVVVIVTENLQKLFQQLFKSENYPINPYLWKKR